jgi:tetrahydromethanopterin S-methyltransferase subunit F
MPKREGASRRVGFRLRHYTQTFSCRFWAVFSGDGRCGVSASDKESLYGHLVEAPSTPDVSSRAERTRSDCRYGNKRITRDSEALKSFMRGLIEGVLSPFLRKI